MRLAKRDRNGPASGADTMGFSTDIALKEPRNPAEPGGAARARLLARIDAVTDGLRAGGSRLGPVLADSLGLQGKCFRGTLMLLTGEALGVAGPAEDAILDAAVACEMIHTASLLIDDLPSMDNAALRRGTPAFHVRHGEATTILAGIALLAEAVRLVSRAPADAGKRAGMAALLADAVGTAGLCEGQLRDLSPEKSAQGIKAEHDLKTGALFVCGFDMVALAAGCGADRQKGMAALGLLLGRCFQCLDDLLDAVGTEESTGKTVGRDGAGRGQLAVRGLDDAVALYHAMRADLDRSLSDCGFAGTAVDRYIAQVLPRDLPGRDAAAASA